MISNISVDYDDFIHQFKVHFIENTDKIKYRYNSYSMSRVMSLKSSAENTAIYNKTKLHQQEGTKGIGSTGPTGPSGPILTSTELLLPYAKTTAITDSLVPYSTTTLMNTAISTALDPYAKTTAVITAIATATTDMDTITLRNTTLASYASLTGRNLFTGVQTTTQASDLLVPLTFSSTPSFSMTDGMVYNMSSNSTALSSLGFTNIPTTPLQTYVFTFIILPSTASSPWYLKPPTNFISITPVEGTINSSVPLYGISNVVLPTAYTYIMEQITIVNTSTTTTPNFMSFVSISGY